MMPVANCGVGANFGFPDVCLTEHILVPLPYPNIGYNFKATNYSPNLYIGFLNAFHLATIIDETMLDAPGEPHPFCEDFSAFVRGNPMIFHNCLPSIHLLCKTIGNGGNCTKHLVAFPSATVTFYNDAAQAPGELSAEGLGALSSAVAGEATAVSASDAGDVRRIAIRRFGPDTGTRLYNALRGHEGAVEIDLSGCPGGDAEAALALAGEFLPQGTALARLVQLDGEETLYRARFPQAYHHPLVVRVDRRTASAAELFAGVLQRLGRARVVGERTAGKSSVQRVLGTPDGLRHATVGAFTTPEGAELRAVSPD